MALWVRKSRKPRMSQKAKAKHAQKKHHLRVIHRYLGRELCENTGSLPEPEKKYLELIAENASSRYRSSAQKRLQHLACAAKILTPVGLTRYISNFGVDRQMRAVMNKSNPKRNSSKTPKTKRSTPISRPLIDVPFSATERWYVEGLLSLLMRTSESVARRSWPQNELPDPDHPRGQFKAARARTKQIRHIRLKMERDERFLDELRGRIELAWPDHNKLPAVHKLSDEKLIDKVRALDYQVLGIALLPSTACILHILDIVNRTYLLEDHSSAEKPCDMPDILRVEFAKQLRRMSLYDNWRATNPPDSERFSDVVMEPL